jgi:hypothetical protein
LGEIETPYFVQIATHVSTCAAEARYPPATAAVTPDSARVACAAASRASGTLNGEQET